MTKIASLSKTRWMHVTRPVALALSGFVLSAIATTCQAQSTEGADTVFINGKVYTVDAANDVFQAIAVKDGKIAAVGSDENIRSQISETTKVIDLHGRMLMPGLIDAHMHPAGGGGMLTTCSLEYVGLTIDEILARITKCLENDSDAPNDSWLEVHAWFRQATKPEGADLTAAILDRLPTDRPVIVVANDFHTVAGNSAAMKAAGITVDTPNPTSGEIVRDNTGAATGIFLDGAIGVLTGAAPKLTPEERAQQNLSNAKAAVTKISSEGVTTILDAAAGEDGMAAWGKLFDDNELTVRSVAAIVISPDEAHDPAKAVARIAAEKSQYSKAGSAVHPGLTIDRAKIFVDGVIQAPAQTGALLQPYLHNVGTDEAPEWVPSDKSGSLYFDQSLLEGMLDELVEKGFGAHMHTDGGRAVRVALNAIESVRKSHNAPWFRPALAHDEEIDPSDYSRFEKLGAIPVLSFQWGKRAPDTIDTVEPQLGPQRFPYAETAGKFEQAGARIAFGSDWPVDPLNEWLAMQIAVTRTNPNPPAARFEGRLGDDPGLNIATAIRAFTINAAYSLNMEDKVGSLEPGKYADLIVIDRDLTSIQPTEIAGTNVLLTMVGGRVVYCNPDDK